MPQQGGLAAAAGPEQKEHLARLDVQVDLVEHAGFAKMLGEFPDGDGCHGR
jgi:hypothetical protein